MIKGFICGDIVEGIIRVCSKLDEFKESRYIEKGIMKRAKNPARTMTIIHVVGKV